MNFSVIKATRSLSRTLSKQVVPVKDIPNLFHDSEVFNELSDEKKYGNFLPCKTLVFLWFLSCVIWTSLRVYVLRFYKT